MTPFLAKLTGSKRGACVVMILATLSLLLPVAFAKLRRAQFPDSHRCHRSSVRGRDCYCD